MSKELERIIGELCDRFDYTEIDDIVEDLKAVKETLTPPTEEEVCKALSAYLKEPITYDKRFGFICNDRVIIGLYPNNVLFFNDNYPANIHYIVGRFYEGVK